MEDILCKQKIKVVKLFKIITFPNKMPNDILKGKKLYL